MLIIMRKYKIYEYLMLLSIDIDRQIFRHCVVYYQHRSYFCRQLEVASIEY